MKNPLPTAIGLARLGAMTLRAPGGPRGPYWSWRRHTAFGPGPVPAGRMLAAAAEYGRWVARMRRLQNERPHHG
jgi:hypothetical protein